MPNRDIIHYDCPALDPLPEAAGKATPGFGRPRPERSGALRKGWAMPAPAPDHSACNPARAMRGPTDHQADGQAAPHQAR